MEHDINSESEIETFLYRALEDLDVWFEFYLVDLVYTWSAVNTLTKNGGGACLIMWEGFDFVICCKCHQEKNNAIVGVGEPAPIAIGTSTLESQ